MDSKTKLRCRAIFLQTGLTGFLWIDRKQVTNLVGPVF